MIDSEFKAKWIAALRSDEYKQGRNSLRSSDNYYCCLGVAADLIDHNAWTIEDGIYYWNEDELSIDPLYFPGVSEEKWKKLAELLSLAAYQNDSGRTFKEIATWLEEHNV